MQRCILAILTLAISAGAQAASENVDLNLVTRQSVGQAIGSVKISETAKGLEFTQISKRYRRVDMVFTFMLTVAASR